MSYLCNIGLPVVYVAFIITHSDCDVSHFTHIKMRVVLVVIRSNPAYPHATGLLSRKYTHRVVMLHTHTQTPFEMIDITSGNNVFLKTSV